LRLAAIESVLPPLPDETPQAMPAQPLARLPLFSRGFWHVLAEPLAWFGRGVSGGKEVK
jgi:hypothetical protein